MDKSQILVALVALTGSQEILRSLYADRDEMLQMPDVRTLETTRDMLDTIIRHTPKDS